MVIVAVLLTLAFPSLMDSIRKSRRSEAFNKLAAVQIAQERFRANNATYATSLSNGAASAPGGLDLPTSTTGGRYTIAPGASAPTANSYGVMAVPVSGSTQADDGNCAQLQLRVQNGNTFYESAPVGGSFSTTAGQACWVR